MRIRYYIILGCLLLILGKNPAFGQGREVIDVSYQNQPLVEVLDEWSERYGLTFMYNPYAFEGIQLTGKIRANELKGAIKQLFSNVPIDFHFSAEKTILLRKSQTKKILSFINIIGRVRDQETGTNLSYATLFVPNSRFGTTAEEDGSFSLRIPDSLSKKKLICRYLGYKAQELSLTSGDFLDIRLEQDEQTMEVVEIEEELDHMLSGMDLGTYKLLNFSPTDQLLGMNDPTRMIQYLPGVNSKSESLAELSVRGGQRDENLILLDDITLFHVDHVQGIFSVFNPNAVSGFTFYQTDFPIEYDGRTSSILAIQGQRGDTSRASLDISLDLYAPRASLSLPLGDKVQLFVAARRASSHFLDRDLIKISGRKSDTVLAGSTLSPLEEANAENVPVPFSKFYDIFGKLSIQPTKRSSLDISYFYSQDFVDYTGAPDMDGDKPSQYFNRPKRSTDLDTLPRPRKLEIDRYESNWVNRGLSASFQLDLNEKGAYNRTFAFASGFERNYVYELESPSQMPIFSFTERNSISYRGIGNHTKLKLDLHDLDMGFTLKHYDVAYAPVIRQRNIADPNYYRHLASSLVGEVYAAATLRFENSLRIKAGLHETYLAIRKEWLHSPRIAASYSPNRNLTLSASAGRYNQYVREVQQLSPYTQAGSFWAFSNNGNIPVSNSTHVSLGGKWRKERLSLSVEGYLKYTNGIITNSITADLDPGEGIFISPQFHEGKAYARGIDVTALYEGDRFEAWISYTLSKLEYSFDFIAKGASYLPPEDQRHSLKFNTSFDLGPFKASASYVFGSGQRYYVLSDSLFEAQIRGDNAFIATELEKLRDYSRIDLALNYSLVGQLGRRRIFTDVGLTVYNLLNTTNISYKQYLFDPTEGLGRIDVAGAEIPLLGFTPNLSIRWRF
ncbi:MAG: TonB-dependent receptor [Bacteroidota bacterium]